LSLYLAILGSNTASATLLPIRFHWSDGQYVIVDLGPSTPVPIVSTFADVHPQPFLERFDIEIKVLDNDLVAEVYPNKFPPYFVQFIFNCIKLLRG
jgi:hypothetical protein